MLNLVQNSEIGPKLVKIGNWPKCGRKCSKLANFDSPTTEMHWVSALALRVGHIGYIQATWPANRHYVLEYLKKYQKSSKMFTNAHKCSLFVGIWPRPNGILCIEVIGYIHIGRAPGAVALPNRTKLLRAYMQERVGHIALELQPSTTDVYVILPPVVSTVHTRTLALGNLAMFS